MSNLAVCHITCGLILVYTSPAARGKGALGCAESAGTKQRFFNCTHCQYACFGMLISPTVIAAVKSIAQNLGLSLALTGNEHGILATYAIRHCPEGGSADSDSASADVLWNDELRHPC